MTTRSADERVLRRTALRVGLQTAAAVAITVVGLAAVAVFVMLQGQHHADDDLVSTAIARTDVTDPPAGTWVVIQRGDLREATPGLPPGLPDAGEIRLVEANGVARSIDTTIRQRDYRVDTERLADGRVIQAMLDLESDQAERSRMLVAFLASGIAGLVVAAAVGVWLARRAVAPMARALALQRRFVADAGHELRTPLTLLSTRAQLIRRSVADGMNPDTLRSDVDGLVRDAHQLTDILDDLLLAADPRRISDSELVELPSLVTQAVDSARPLADEHGITLSCTTIDEPPPVAGASASLRRAVIALLDNAIRHATSQVRLTIGTSGTNATIDVADDGPGLAPEAVPTVFARFATSPADGRPGTRRRYGLGLALVSEIATRHGGSVSVVDTDAPGATFRLRLPGRIGLPTNDHRHNRRPDTQRAGIGRGERQEDVPREM